MHVLLTLQFKNYLTLGYVVLRLNNSGFDRTLEMPLLKYAANNVAK